MKTRTIFDGLGFTYNFGAGVGSTLPAVLNAFHEADLADLSMPLLGDSHEILGLVPLLGMFLAIMKIINAARSGYRWYNGDYLRNEVLINLVSELISGGILMGFCSEAYKTSALQGTAILLPSIAFAYIGFAGSALIDLIHSAQRIYHTYTRKDINTHASYTENISHNFNETENISHDFNEKEENIDEYYKNNPTTIHADNYHTALINFTISLFKFIGWSMLALGSTLGLGSMVMTIGWALIGATAGFQLCKSVYTCCGLFSPSSSTTPEELILRQQINACQHFV
ncbi:MAG: hypothetical protein K0R24_1150 [Gammaproteobacteria bacterium]|nr:hypothetical protein [Gammaproteobacteria bacterium]MDF3055595.1 hypothetical protein [Gammaproteobacteria bacterium]